MNGNKGELSVRLPINSKQLATKMGVPVAQLVSDLVFRLKVRVTSIGMDLPSYAVVAVAELHNMQVRFLPTDDGFGS